MDFSQIGRLIEANATVSTISTIVGALAGHAIGRVRKGLKVIEYSVTHTRIAISAKDGQLGDTTVFWREHKLDNLFVTKLLLKNETSEDLKDFKIKIYSGTTILLSSRGQILNSPFGTKSCPEFEARLVVEDGQGFSELQQALISTTREYTVEVFNRGQSVEFLILTTIPNSETWPYVWADTNTLGVKLIESNYEEKAFGSPKMKAIYFGLVFCGFVATLCGLFLNSVWIASVTTLIAGLFILPVGAYLWRLTTGVQRFIIQ